LGRALPRPRNSWQIPYKVRHMRMVVNILVDMDLGSTRILEGILAGSRRTKNCDFVDNPLERLGLTLDKTKRRPVEEHCMEGQS